MLLNTGTRFVFQVFPFTERIGCSEQPIIVMPKHTYIEQINTTIQRVVKCAIKLDASDLGRSTFELDLKFVGFFFAIWIVVLGAYFY